jgi:TonB family protein
MISTSNKCEDDAPIGSAPLYYAWEVPDKPVTVRLSLDLVDRLGSDVINKFKDINSRGSEVGGILLGHVVDAHKQTFFIDDYALISCDYIRGSLFFLSDECKSQMADQLLRVRTSSPNSVVGFFRSHTRKNLGLDEHEVAMIREYFPGPASVFLLIKPYAARPSTAGFFIWENGEIRAESSYHQFPFRRSELIIRATEKVVASDTNPAQNGIRLAANALPRFPAAAKTAPAPEEPPPNPESIDFILKQISREPDDNARIRSCTAGEPDWGFWPQLPREPNIISNPGWDLEHARLRSQTSFKQEERAQRDQHNGRPDDQPPTRSAPRPTQPRFEPNVRRKPDSTPHNGQVVMREESFGRALRWVWISLIMLLVLEGAYVEYRIGGSKSIATSPSRDALDLSVNRDADRLTVSWNQNATIIATAKGATLRIQDGLHEENLDLSPEQLRSGRIIYSPFSDDVSFRLEVTDAKAARTVSEWVRALGSLTKSPNGRSIGDGPANPANKSVVVQQKRTDSVSERPILEKGPAWTVFPSEKNSVPADVRAESGKAESAPRPDFTQLPGSAVLRGAVQQAPPSVSAAELHAPSREAQELVIPTPEIPASGDRIVPAKLIQAAPPRYPESARLARVSGLVQVEAVVGIDGNVKSAIAASGPLMLQNAAVEAVRGFRYQPATRDGRPVESLTQIDVNFIPSR